MSFCNVPPSIARGTPVSSASATKSASITAAGELIVIEVVIADKSIPSKRSATSASESIATPQRPTSPSDIGSSESSPSRVGISKAVESPVPPARMISLKRALVSTAVPKPANMRMVHSRERYIEGCTPRV